MTGTWVNAAAIVLGGLLGLLLKKGLPAQVEDTAIHLVGLGVLVIGINGILTSMMQVNLETGRLSDQGGIVLVLSLVVGGLLGSLLRIEDRINAFGQQIERRLGSEGFAKGFVSASILYCVGAMAIVGALSDGLRGDSSILFTKSTLDGITSIVFASSLGVGVLFAAVPVLVYQGAISLGAGLLAPVLTRGTLLDLICMVGYCIVLVIGTNLMGLTKYKTADMIPALLGPVVYNLIMMLKIM
ncbi:MAG: DUF554 domain-containing protein [Oscillospiraceae bacterium]